MISCARCRNQAAKCKFRDTTESDERLIKQIIIRTKHQKIQERLLSKGDSLTLDEATDVCRTYEATLSQLTQLHAEKERKQPCVQWGTTPAVEPGGTISARNAQIAEVSMPNHVISALHIARSVKAVAKPTTVSLKTPARNT